MSNKTCGECRHFRQEDFKNMCLWADHHRKACADFALPTNGDKIRQEGIRDFAEYFVYEIGAMFASTLIDDKTFDTYEEVVKATEDYLNAPAESDGKKIELNTFYVPNDDKSAEVSNGRKACVNCIQYQPNWRYCPLMDLFTPPDSSCKEFTAKKDEVKDEK